jgi:BON domain
MKEDLEHVVELGGTPAASRNLATGEAWPGITVTTRGGKAVLIGTVRSWEERRAAEHAAWALPDVREIDDRLVVAERVAGAPARRDSARDAHRPPG